ncbi:MAG: DUF2806 domain-containing protein [Balneolales bacterium]
MSGLNAGSALSAITGAVSDLVTGGSLPAPIKRNAIKAFGELCSALIDIPVAKLEGKAAEIRAETGSRVKLIARAAENIASQMQVDKAYADVAVERYGKRILQQQQNLDNVCAFSATEIKRVKAYSSSSANSIASGSSESAEPRSFQPDISDDWLNSFREQAILKSSDEMRIIFGKILAGEIVKPGSFSIRSIQIMGQLDVKPAMLFRRLCSLCISLRPNGTIFDARVPSFGGNASNNSLQEYGLSFDSLNVLQEYGLIISDYNSSLDYRVSVLINNRVGLPFVFGDKQYVLVPSNPNDWMANKALKIHGVGLSAAGKELISIVEAEHNMKFLEAFASFVNDQGLAIKELQASI